MVRNLHDQFHTIGIRPTFQHNLKISIKFHFSLKQVTFEERVKLMSKVHDPSFKGTFPRTLKTIQYHNQLNFNTSKVFNILKERFLTFPVVIYTRKNFYLNAEINKNIRSLQTAGIIEYWHSLMVDKRFIDIKSEDGPKQLKMSHLKSSFGILIIGLFLAVVSFVFEKLRKFCGHWILIWSTGYQPGWEIFDLLKILIFKVNLMIFIKMTFT